LTPIGKAEDLMRAEFGSFSTVLSAHAAEVPEQAALVDANSQMSWREMEVATDRYAAALQRDGLRPGEAVAVCAFNSVAYAAVYLAVVKAGGVVAPLAPSSTPESLVLMISDSAARFLFLDKPMAAHLEGVRGAIKAQWIGLDDAPGTRSLDDWAGRDPATPIAVTPSPNDAFNIIYSSGTTGTPKGIVQPHVMRWQQIRSAFFVDRPVTLLSTPLYSNTTLVAFLPTLVNGGTAVLMPKFDVQGFLTLSAAHRVTHAMLVPVQYRRIMEAENFASFDLSAFRMKFCTSAPFSAALKRDVLDRWPGGLVEFYGMTEGGGSCMLMAHIFPDKLHTVGQPIPGHEIILIGEDGKVLPQGEIGEIVGRSGSMMLGYRNQEGKTKEAHWVAPDGGVWIRTGDVGRFDEDGFLTLMDRKKDMIISGGFNIYPSDIEAELAQHSDIVESAVVGIPSDDWGETPIAFVVLREGAQANAADIKAWLNGRVGKTQRLSDVRLLDALPRSHIGKTLKRELRDGYQNA
jgi:long-chain acyl-CoA synthetase